MKAGVNVVKPKALKKGDTIGVVAPSGFSEESNLNKAKAILENEGYIVKCGKSCYEKYGYLAGHDEIRAEDINLMFQNPEIDAVFCMKGGYGAPRILDRIDYESISKNPKIFIGYSDITALHIPFVQKSGLVTFHGPMLTSDFLSKEFFEQAFRDMLRALTTPEPLGKIKAPPMCPKEEMLVAGSAEGTTIGGNLSLIAASLGTPYEIDTKQKLLLLEDVDEEPYSIDRMLTQLRLAGKLEEASGIVLGQFTNCNPKEPENSLTLDEIFCDILVPLGKPIIENVCFGHGPYKYTLPLGVKARIDQEETAFIVEESALHL
nr:LD-carboxypeptidase [Tepidanaerobacter syntrophicus]